MIPDIVCIWVSLFLAQRPSSATFLLARRCHSTWRNALGAQKMKFPDFALTLVESMY
jgi:hypothetical protein